MATLISEDILSADEPLKHVRVPYLLWRAGRPRWEPGPSLRKEAISGRDLRTAEGGWMSQRQAIEAAVAINIEFGIARPVSCSAATSDATALETLRASNLMKRRSQRPPKTPRGQFIYVFTMDRRWAKIGYSTNPRARWAGLSQALPLPLVPEIVTLGSLADEALLHRAFAGCLLQNEWFRIAGPLAAWLYPTLESNNRKSDYRSDFSENVCSFFDR